MTIDENYIFANELVIKMNEDIDNYMFSVLIPYAENQLKYTVNKKYLIDALLMKKRIDEAEYKKVKHESPQDTVCNGCQWEIGWNDCLKWAKGETDDRGRRGRK